MLLNHDWIEAHIPHCGNMVLLDRVLEWDASQIRCLTATHRAADHPMRRHGRLGIACGIEYAAQTMAVHGALSATAMRSEVGFLASLRDVRFHVLRLDDIEDELYCEASRIAGDAATALYEFSLSSPARRLLTGRATVVLDVHRRLDL